MIFISSLEIISVVKSDRIIFLWIAASVADATAVGPNGIKTLLVNSSITFPIKGNPVFDNGPIKPIAFLSKNLSKSLLLIDFLDFQ